MSDAEPKRESLIERARRKAREAEAAVPPTGSELGQVGLLGAAAAGGVAGGLKDATSPASYSFNSARTPQATLRVFTDALKALGDHDTRPEVLLQNDQATVKFLQQLPTGNWVTAVTISFVQKSDEVNIAASAPSLAAVGGAAAEVGGTALGSLGKVLSGNVIGGLTEAARNMGRLTESAENLVLSNKIRETVQRLGNTLDDEWQTVQREKKVQEEKKLMLATCKFCGAPFEDNDAQVCAICGAPRVQGKPEAQ
ncbi:MAG: hypothetical protein JNL09_08865 [Anaerolineales bacterium]|nr:hypothetical protein [Anaerolineales bacterium]